MDGENTVLVAGGMLVPGHGTGEVSLINITASALPKGELTTKKN